MYMMFRVTPLAAVMVGTAMMAASSSLGAVVYDDSTGDIATGNPNLDITSVTVWDNGSDLGFTITVDNLDADWGKYMLFIDYQTVVLATTTTLGLEMSAVLGEWTSSLECGWIMAITPLRTVTQVAGTKATPLVSMLIGRQTQSPLS